MAAFIYKDNKIVKYVVPIAAILISGCSAITHPTPFGLYNGMRDGAPEGTDTFREGWKAGCESGMSAVGSLHYKFTHHYTYDQTKLDNDEYQDAWRMAFRHCRWYTAEWQKNLVGDIL
jgi:hypothetical protein